MPPIQDHLEYIKKNLAPTNHSPLSPVTQADALLNHSNHHSGPRRAPIFTSDTAMTSMLGLVLGTPNAIGTYTSSTRKRRPSEDGNWEANSPQSTQNESPGTLGSSPYDGDDASPHPGGAVVLDIPTPGTGTSGTGVITLSWDFSMMVKATKNEAKKLGTSEKIILKDVCGSVQSGDMVAVMGSSGAGKSSFLDCVSLRNQKFQGNVFINNKPADERFYFMTGKWLHCFFGLHLFLSMFTNLYVCMCIRNVLLKK